MYAPFFEKRQAREYYEITAKDRAYDYDRRITTWREGGASYEYISCGSNYSTSSDWTASFRGSAGPSTVVEQWPSSFGAN
jgi:hypothetical protein